MRHSSFRTNFSVLVVLAALLTWSASAIATPTFNLGTPVNVGDTQRAVAAGDVTGDGKPDLLCNHGDAGVLIFPGNGNGTFGAPTTYDTPYLTVTSIAVGRFNADTLNDLAFTSYGSKGIVVAMATGSGSFGSPTLLPAGLGPEHVLISDFYNIGYRGVAVTNFYSNTVSVYPGNGDGTFGPQICFGTGVYPTGLDVADFDLDGRLDFGMSCNDPGLISVVNGSVGFPGYFDPRADRSAGGP